MRRRFIGAIAIATAAALVITGCSSSKKSGSSGASGSVTLKLVAADYGTGPANSSQKYWQRSRTRSTPRTRLSA